MRIVVICVDCLRKDAVKPDSKIGRFISENLNFDNGYASGPATTPSVVTCLSGYVAGEHGSITTASPLRVESWVQGLHARGFNTVCYTENNFFQPLENHFDEWNALPWMKDRDKYTSPDYNRIWERIETEKRDAFYYVHLMDVHPPYRFYDPITPDMFPYKMWGYQLTQWVNACANEGRPSLTDEQFGYLWQLMEGEVATLDRKIEFPGDIVFLIADHGELIGDVYNMGRWWSHNAKHFTEQQLRIPLAAKGLSKTGIYEQPFVTRFIGDLLFAELDGGSWPDGSELYWEDYWYGCVHHAVCHDGHYLGISSDGTIALDNKYVSFDEVPESVLRYLVTSMVRHNNHQHLYSTNPPYMPKEEETKIIEDRLKGLGYL